MKPVKCPFFITPHAVRQFRERVAPLPPGLVIEVIQERLQTILQPGLCPEGLAYG